MLHIDELARRHTAKLTDILLYEEALFAARLFENGWALIKIAAYYARFFSCAWFTMLWPLLAWSEPLEWVVRYATLPLKLIAVGSGILLYGYTLRRAQKYLFDKSTTANKLALSPLPKKPLSAPAGSSANKGFKGSLHRGLRVLARLFWNGTKSLSGALVVYRVVLIGGAVLITIFTLIKPNSELSNTYFGHANAWQFQQLFARFGAQPKDFITFLEHLKPSGNDHAGTSGFEQRFYLPPASG